MRGTWTPPSPPSISELLFHALSHCSESVEAKATAHCRLYRNSSSRALKAWISVGQIYDHALGKKTRTSQWLASVYELSEISVILSDYRCWKCERCDKPLRRPSMTPVHSKAGAGFPIATFDMFNQARIDEARSKTIVFDRDRSKGQKKWDHTIPRDIRRSRKSRSS